MPPRTAAVRAVNLEALDGADAPMRLPLVDGVDVAVNPPRLWRLSAMRALREGDFEKWAQGALASETDVNAFFDADPTFAQIETFMKAMNEASPEGKSTTSSPSSPRSKRTPKR